MTYVVTEKCVDCKYTTCVAVCPVDAFHELPDRLYINPETCIDCNACMDECPVEAIYPDMDVPDELQEWIELTRRPNGPPKRTQMRRFKRRSIEHFCTPKGNLTTISHPVINYIEINLSGLIYFSVIHA